MKRFCLLLASIAFLVACTHQIETGLSERDAQEIAVTLRENGIDAGVVPASTGNKDSALWSVNVKGGEDKAVAAWKVLREHGLPHERVQGLEDVFKNSGMIPTATEEKAKLLVGLSGELTRTLRSVPGVVDARVQVVLPAENAMLLDKKDQDSTTASVLVRYNGEHSPLTDDEIRGLVAKGVEGLQPENVDVVQKQAAEKPLPQETTGNFADRQWITIAALALSAITSAGAISLLLVSKQRAFRIKALERQLERASGGTARLPGSSPV